MNENIGINLLIGMLSCLIAITAARTGKILKRLDALAEQCVQQTCDQRADNDPEQPFKPAGDATPALVHHGASLVSEAGADEDGLILSEGVRLPPHDQPAPLQLSGNDGIGPAELDIASRGIDHFENSVVPFVHADNSTTNAAPRGN